MKHPFTLSRLLPCLLALIALCAPAAAAPDLRGVSYDFTTKRALPTNFFASNVLAGAHITVAGSTNGTVTITGKTNHVTAAFGSLDVTNGIVVGGAVRSSGDYLDLRAGGGVGTGLQILDTSNDISPLGAGTTLGEAFPFDSMRAGSLHLTDDLFAPDLFSIFVGESSGVTFDSAAKSITPAGLSLSLGRADARFSELFSTNADFLASIKLQGLTASRPAFINAQGTLTNATGTPDGTKFLRDDGVLAVPEGGGSGSTQMVAAAIGDLTVTNDIFVGFNQSPGLITIVGTNIFGAPTNTGLVLTNTDPALVSVQKPSPVIQQWGNGWKTTATAASQPIGVSYYVEPVQGTTTPTANWVMRWSTNGTALGANAALSVSSSGGLTLGGGLVLPTSSSISAPSGTITVGSGMDAVRLAAVAYIGTSGGVAGVTSGGGTANQGWSASNFVAQSFVMSGGNPTTTKATRRAGGSSTNVNLGGTYFAAFTPVASAGSAETNLLSCMIGGHTLTNNGDSFRFIASGRFAASATTKQIKAVFGSQTILDTTAVLLNDGAWVIQGQVIRTGNTAQAALASYSGLGIATVKAAEVVQLAQTNGIDTVLKITSTASDNGAVTNVSLFVTWHPAY